MLIAGLWLVGLVPAVLLIAQDWSQSHEMLIADQRVMIGRDFVNLWVGGKMAWGGMLDSLYDPSAYLAAARSWFAGLGRHNFSYPPQSLLLGMPLAMLPYPAALAVWTAGTGALFWCAARPFMRGLPAWLALLTPAALVNIWAGQYGFLAGALWLFAFTAIDRNKGRSGIAAGLLTIKPHLGLLIPLIWIVRRRWQAIGVAVATTAAIVIVSGLVFGFDLWSDYLIKAPAAQRAVLTAPGDHLFFHMMPTTFAALRGQAEPWPMLAQAVTAIIALALVWRALNAESTDLAFIAATATFLILPYAFNYDMTVATLGFGLLIARRWQKLAWWEAPVLCLAFLVPERMMITVGGIGQWVVPAILLAALWVQVRHAREAHESAV